MPAPAADRPRVVRAVRRGARRAGSWGPGSPRPSGGRPGACHVLDAKYEPGVRAPCSSTSRPGDSLRGDLRARRRPGRCRSGPDGRARRARLAASRTTPSCRLCRASWTPPAWAGPGGGRVAGRSPTHGVARSAAACELLRYRPGQARRPCWSRQGPRPPGLRGQGLPRAPPRRRLWWRRRPAPGATTPRGARCRFAPAVGFVPDLGLVVQQRVAGCTARPPAAQP